MASHPEVGLFTNSHPGMVAFLRRTSQDPEATNAFVARNFLLDEGVTQRRIDGYHDSGAIAAHASFSGWKAIHHAYLSDAIWARGADRLPPKRIDPTDPDVCPETFRGIDPNSFFRCSDPQLLLVRVENLSGIARRAGVGADEIRELATHAIATKHARDDRYERLSLILEDWSASIDLRPVFAGFWRELEDLFGDDPSKDRAGWADLLRDRLGLAHYNPDARTQPAIEILVLRYRVKLVPHMIGMDRDHVALVPPTVLDQEFSPPFCPAPAGSITGHTVDLSRDIPPLRSEVLHPRPLFTAEHVFRVGEIRGGVTDERLAEARAWFLTCVRDVSGRNDYAAETDGDLLT